MKYCSRCVTPDTRPHIVLDAEGVCNACGAHARRSAIDWTLREKQFSDLVTSIKKRKARYDCLIPVSGGKDSTWQVVQCLKYGLHPLAVTWKPPSRTELGTRNLANLVSLGVDHVDFQVNPQVEKKFLYQSLLRFGSTAIPMHMALFAIPLTFAVKFDIPLVVWGENSAVEYGGSEGDLQNFRLNGEWLRKYGVTQGTNASEWVSSDLTESEMTPYFAPTDRELDQKEILAIFLGYFFPWDPESSRRVAEAHGFQTRQEGPKTGYYNFADIDDEFISVHHYLKWHKFGFTRLFDNLSLEIRNGRLTRKEVINLIAKSGDQTPHEDIAKLCAYLNISVSEFHQIADRFRNKKIWSCEGGLWKMEDFLIKGWEWNETC